jgi:uncharacterized protein (DUF433 family)
MEYVSERIVIDTKICNGKPTIRGSRIIVQSILEYLSSGGSQEEILKQFPKLQTEDIQAVLKFDANLMDRDYSIKPVE